MRRILFFFILTSVYFSVSVGQDRLIGDEKIMSEIKCGLDCMYNYEFEKADSLFRIIENEIPNHPVSPFLGGLSIYWQNAPLNPNNSDAVNMFIRKMKESSVLSDEVMKGGDDYIEGSFFSLVAHAMQMMYYADNDQIIKVIKHIPYSYKRIVGAIKLNDTFEEYKFFTGLYNYYIEAYPEAHPAYKPLLIFLHKGNRSEGLKELNWVANNSVFMKAEGLFFLHHIYMSYECNPQMALNYAEQLHKLYPDNTFYLVHLIFNLFVVKDYEKAAEFILMLEQQKKSDDFAQMMGLIFNGMIEELVNRNYEMSKELYINGIEMAVMFKPRVDTYIAMAYAGLSRIYEREGMVKLAKENKKIAFEKTDYPCILE